jgi:hypothetical protein
MMNNSGGKALRLPLVVGAAVLYLLLNMPWLAAANSPNVGSETRPLLKALCLTAALLVYFGLAVWVAVRENVDWVSRTAISTAIAVGLGLVLIVIASALWRRGQFFHDAEPLQRFPSLIALILGISGVAAVFALVLGAFGRMMWRR